MWKGRVSLVTTPYFLTTDNLVNIGRFAAVGGIFAGSAAWAIYAELVTRVPWQKQQQAFFEMELAQSKQSLDRSTSRWTKEVEPALKAKIDRKAELEKSQTSGAYAEAKGRLDQLNAQFDEAEMGIHRQVLCHGHVCVEP